MSDIWLADVATAFAVLRPTEDERASIVEMLAPAPSSASEKPRTVVSSRERRDTAGGAVSGIADLDVAGLPAIVTLPVRSSQQSDVPAVAPAFAATTDDEGTGPGRLRRRLGALLGALGGLVGAIGRPRRSTQAAPGALVPAGHEIVDDEPGQHPTLSRADQTLFGGALPFESLLAPRSARTVIHLLLARRTADGPLDADAAVTLLAQQRPLQTLPRLHRRTLRFGAQLLVDRSDSMRPFSRDQHELVKRVRHLLGTARTEVRYFTGSPMRGVMSRPVGHRYRYGLPARGTLILVLSDFGTMGHLNCVPGAPRTEWEKFFRLCATSGDEIVALVPYPVERAPSWLSREVDLVTWDRTTTANAVSVRLR